MACKGCQGLCPQLREDEQLLWLGYAVRVIRMPAGVTDEERDCWTKLIDSGLAWKVDHIGPCGEPWLCLHWAGHKGQERYETVRLEPGCYERIPCDPVYSVIQSGPPPKDDGTC